MRKMLSLLCVLALILGLPALAVEYGAELNPNEKTYTQRFSDVPTNHWAFQYVGELVERGAINGYPDGKFYPDKIVTREEFAKIMVVAAGLTPAPAKSSSYTDVDVTYWASPFIETAKPYMTAYQDSWGGTSFHPKDGALREDIAVAVVKLKGYDTRLADLSVIQTMFSDVDGISAAAQPYVALAVENGIISGYVDGTFRGQATITRSEAAAMLWRAFQYGNDNKVIATEATPAPKPSEKPAPSAGPTASAKPSADPKPTPMPTATPEPAKPFVAETLVKNVEISDTHMMMTMDGDSNLIFYNAKSNKIVSLNPSTDKTATLLDVARATIEVPIEAQTAGLSALEDEEGDEPPAAAETEPPLDEEEPAQEPEPEPEPEVPSTVTYKDLTVQQVFWDDVAGRLLIVGKFASIQNDDGWKVPGKKTELKGTFILDNGELNYLTEGTSHLFCALQNGTYVTNLDYYDRDIEFYSSIENKDDESIVVQLGMDIYKIGNENGYITDYLCKVDFGSGKWKKVKDFALLQRMYAYRDGLFYTWTGYGIYAIRPADAATQSKLDPTVDVQVLDMTAISSVPSYILNENGRFFVTSDGQYIFCDRSANAIRVIRPNPNA